MLFEAPSYYQVYRFQKAWIAENAELYLQQTNPDAWKSRAMVAYGNASEDVLRLNQRWEMDATPADWLLLDPDCKKRRYTVSCIIDNYSRRALVVVAPTPKTQTHCFALRQALRLWGVPEQIVTDNGQDYQSDHFRRVLGALGIEHRTTAPFSGDEKPHIERFIGTLNHSILETLPNFVGHNVAERKAIESRRSFADRLAKKGEIVDFADVVDGTCTGYTTPATVSDHEVCNSASALLNTVPPARPVRPYPTMRAPPSWPPTGHCCCTVHRGSQGRSKVAPFSLSTGARTAYPAHRSAHAPPASTAHRQTLRRVIHGSSRNASGYRAALGSTTCAVAFVP